MGTNALEWLLPVLSLGLLVIALVALVGGFHNRLAGKQPKGIGWQFIRFMVLSTALPIIGVLALNDALSGEAAALIGGAMGYAFGKTDEAASNDKKSKARGTIESEPSG
jgi:hypothetical protein